MMINYVTRYLLRVEVSVAGGSPVNPANIKFVDTGLESVEGRAEVQAVLNNESPNPYAFRLRVRLVNHSGKPLGPPFFLSHPVRRSSPVPERYECRIFGKTSILLASQIPEPILPGKYTMEFELQSRARTLKKHSVDVEVKKGQFPAQQSVVARIVGDIQASPARIELSRRPRGQRRVPLKLANWSDQAANVKLRAYLRGDSSEEHIPWLTVRPKTIRLTPGRTRSVLVAASTREAEDKHLYAFLEVTVEPEKTLVGGKKLFPIAFLAPGELKLKYKIGDFIFDPSGQYPAAALSVHNEGDIHLALDGVMELDNPFGGKAKVRGGFGRWVLPGDTGKIRFRFKRIPPPGSYPVVMDLYIGHEEKPMRLERTFKVE